MALIRCTECGKQFSDKAFACPNCGCPTNEIQQIMKKNISTEPSETEDMRVISKEETPVSTSKDRLEEDATKVVVEEPNQESAPKQSDNSDFKSSNPKKKTLPIIFAVIGAVAIAVVLLLLFLPRGFSDNSRKISEASQSVLTLYCFEDINAEFDDQTWISSGSGFLLYDNSTIVTNYHVIDGACKVFAFSEDDQVFEITTLSAYDATRDIAILKTNKPTSLKVLTKGDNTQLRKGDKVTAIGSPQGLKNTVTTGSYSGMVFIEDYHEDLLQFSASISSGSSGGALFNERGQLIGMTTASLTEGENLNFAVPESIIDEVYNSTDTTMSLAECAQIDTSDSNYINMPQLAMRDSENVTIGEYKNNYSSYIGHNISIRGFVVDSQAWLMNKTIKISESPQGEADKSVSLVCTLEESGSILGTPTLGAEVAVYFIADSKDSVNAYFIMVF